MRTKLLLAAVAVVCLTNLAALGLGAFNRGGVTSDVTLTERELRLASIRSSVTLLRIHWLQPSPMAFRDEFVERAGFAAPHAGAERNLREYADRQTARNVYVALEYDGPAWQQYRDTVLRRELEGAPAPPLTAAQLEQQRRSREEMVARHSRLFAIDVDRDARRLRGRHPDSLRVLISRAIGRLTFTYDGKGPLLVVSITQLTPDAINVPRPFSLALRTLTGSQPSTYGDPLAEPPRYSVQLRYGRFFEPWVERVAQLRAF